MNDANLDLDQDFADEIDTELGSDYLVDESLVDEVEEGVRLRERCPFCRTDWICGDDNAVFCLDIRRGSGDQYITFHPCCERLADEVAIEEEWDERTESLVPTYANWKFVFGRSLEETVRELFGWEVKRILEGGTIDCGLSIRSPGLVTGRSDSPGGVTVESPEGYQAEVFADVAEHHRHHEAPQGWRFGLTVYNGPTKVGVAVVARPVARQLATRNPATLEVTRVATFGSSQLNRNASSKLYAASLEKAREVHQATTVIGALALLGACRASGLPLRWLSVYLTARIESAKLVTYTHEGESGSSLKASGFVAARVSRAEDWNRPSRGRGVGRAPETSKTRWERKY